MVIVKVLCLYLEFALVIVVLLVTVMGVHYSRSGSATLLVIEMAERMVIAQGRLIRLIIEMAAMMVLVLAIRSRELMMGPPTE